MHNVFGKAKRIIKDRLGFYLMTQNINFDMTRSQKRVLLCFLDYQCINKAYRRSVYHTNINEMYQIIKVLINNNLVIDICAHNRTSILPVIKENRYDYIFGMGEVFRQAGKLHPKAHTIIYMSENPYGISYKQEKERIDYFEERHKRKIPFSRTGVFYHKEDEKSANSIICLGAERYYDSCKGKVYHIHPTAFKNPQWNNRMDNRQKNNFLILGTGGFVHKGIDLLIEVFQKNPQWNLFICGNQVTKEAQRLGYKLTNNIIDYGFVDIHSDNFLELVAKCTFVVLPSCSESLSTAVLTGMCHGLIPIVTKSMGFEKFEKYCFFFSSYFMEAITEGIEMALNIQEEELRRKSNEVFEFANAEFTLDNFNDALDVVVKDIVNEN